jgi:hypothetical protein
MLFCARRFEQMARIAKALGLHLPATTDRTMQSFEEFLDPRLRHHQEGQEDSSAEPHLTELARQTYQLFKEVGLDRLSCDSAGLRERMCIIRAILEVLAPRFLRNQELDSRNRQPDDHLEALTAELKDIQRSYS